MKRREFITLLAGAAASPPIIGPLAAHAQRGEPIRRIGVIMQIAQSDPEAQARMAALLRGLEQFGWTDGRNIRIEYRGAADPDRVRSEATDLIAFDPEVILAVTILAVQELQRHTRTIPIVFVNLGDPIDAGVVASLSHPGGNTTGFMGPEPTMGGKWLELLKEIAPGVNRVLVMTNPGNSGNQGFLRAVEASAPSFGVRVSSLDVRDVGEIEAAIGDASRDANAGLIVMPGGPVTVHRKTIIGLTARHRLPAIYAFRYYAAEGGLMSYGSDVLDMWRRAATYVDRILKGEKPSELPVQAPVKFELILNLRTAKALGLDIPPMLLARADEVIE